MYFDDSIKLSPQLPKAVTSLIDEASQAYKMNDEMTFLLVWPRLEGLIKSLYELGDIQGKDFNRIYEMFGQDWWNVDPGDPDVQVKPFGDDTPQAAPIYKKLAEEWAARNG